MHKQISITLPDDVRAWFEAEAKTQQLTLAPFIRATLIRVARHDNRSRTVPILDRQAEVIARPPAAEQPAAPAAAAPLVDIAGRPREPDAFDESFDPPRPPPAARPAAGTAPRWRYKAQGG